MNFLRKLFGEKVNARKQNIKKPTGRSVRIRVTCPQCNKETNAVLPNSGDERDNEPEIKCEQCKKVFKFRVGMPYEPLGYVN